jgi:hypothetical protein
LQALRPEQFLQVTAPMHATLARGLAARDRFAPQVRLPVGNPVYSSAFRRLTRSGGPVAKRLERMGADVRPGAAARGVPRRMRGAADPAPLDAEAPELRAMKSTILAQMDPKVTVLDAVRQEMPSADSTDLIRFAPTFPQAMYEPLRDYFQGMFLPGLDRVPPNTIALLETNQPFIEAYMAGLNHEMSRELLWRDTRPTGAARTSVSSGTFADGSRRHAGGARPADGHHADRDLGRRQSSR